MRSQFKPTRPRRTASSQANHIKSDILDRVDMLLEYIGYQSPPLGYFLFPKLLCVPSLTCRRGHAQIDQYKDKCSKNSLVNNSTIRSSYESQRGIDYALCSIVRANKCLEKWM